MLDLKRVMQAKPKEHVKAQQRTMTTPWGEALDTAHVLEEHPNPFFERFFFRTLNGTWRCAFEAAEWVKGTDLEESVAAAQAPGAELFDTDIVVPFSPEALLSGVGRQLQPNELLWYRRTFDAPALSAGERCLLHFQAVDYACACRINGQLVGTHEGGYTPFTFDITDALVEADNELVVCVADPSEYGEQLRGKQRIDRGDIWYTAQSGIWQTVWLEVVPQNYIADIVVEAEARTGIVTVGALLQYNAEPHGDEEFRVEVVADGEVVASGASMATEDSCAVAVHLDDPHLWSPESPYLYKLRLTFGQDSADSYCAFRLVEVKSGGRRDHKRVYLNGVPLLVKGVLDQGYWSDGLMTAPSDEALVFDIEQAKAAGFNLMRKHVKIESMRWYYHCDRLGMLVMQDMVSGGSNPGLETWQWSYKPTLFKASWANMKDTTPFNMGKLGASSEHYRREWTRTCKEAIGLLAGHPSIICWSLFNEGWGQFDAAGACEMVRALDATRLVDATSGWYDQRCGDFKSVHNYFRDMQVWSDRKRERAFIISEFGGLTCAAKGHCAFDDKYGYDAVATLGQFCRAVADAVAHVARLRHDGLAGYVYTQLSDIEEEVNGILTYDRRVNKLGATKIA